MGPGRLSNDSCNLLSALQACDTCDESPPRLSSNKSSEGETAIVGQECPRLRPFKVGDIQTPMPANERWYQNKEAVRVLLNVREQGAKLKHSKHKVPTAKIITKHLSATTRITSSAADTRLCKVGESKQHNVSSSCAAPQ